MINTYTIKSSVLTHAKQAALCGTFVAVALLSTTFGSVSGSTLSVTPAPASAEVSKWATRHSASKNVPDLSGAIEERSELMKKSVTIHFISGTGTVVTDWKVILQEHPLWILFDTSIIGKAKAVVSEEKIVQFLDSFPMKNIPASKSCKILSEQKDAHGVIRAQTDCIAQNGYAYDNKEIAKLIKLALHSGTPEITYALESVVGSITGGSASGAIVTGKLGLLSTGQSNFKGSALGRKANVRKALNEKVNNIIVPAGATFSFNDALGGNVSTANGWFMALTIFEGENLRPAPGGGICQASTTLYRAALRAGFPILEHRNHSLYVTYYEQHGVGQDATIYPGQQNMTFVNDTPGPILIQSYDRGDDAFVHIYGIEDHRSVSLSGPYFAQNAVGNIPATSKIHTNEIAWKRSVQLPMGELKEEVIVARYKAIPRSLAKRSPATVSQVRGITSDTLASVTAIANR